MRAPADGRACCLRLVLSCLCCLSAANVPACFAGAGLSACFVRRVLSVSAGILFFDR